MASEQQQPTPGLIPATCKSIDRFTYCFATGRCGTALLAQLFANRRWIPGKYYPAIDTLGRTALAIHERGLPSSKEIRQLPLDNPKNIELQTRLMTDWLAKTAELVPGIHRLICTDNRGRFFANAVEQSPVPARIIYLSREPAAVIASFIQRIDWKRRHSTRAQFTNWLQDVWRAVLFYLDDECTLVPVTQTIWQTWTLPQQLAWYCEETQKQWMQLKQRLSPERYCEIEYEDLIRGSNLAQLAEFVGIPCHPAWLRLRVNASNRDEE
jgi:hypothetical protein